MMHKTEKEFAKLLTSQGKKWKYEPTKLYLKDNNYIPDFYVYGDNIYYEVKTQTSEANIFIKNRLPQINKLYPKLKFKVVLPNGKSVTKDNVMEYGSSVPMKITNKTDLIICNLKYKALTKHKIRITKMRILELIMLKINSDKNCQKALWQFIKEDC